MTKTENGSPTRAACVILWVMKKLIFLVVLAVLAGIAYKVLTTEIPIDES